MRPAVLSAGAPPGGQSAETPGFARAASGSVEPPCRQRETMVHRFRTGDALLEAALALRASGAAAARVYVDRRTNEARVAILDTPLIHRDAARPCPFMDRSSEACT